MVTLHFYGAAGEITGSNHLIDTGEHKYIVDCGLFQGSHELTKHNVDDFPFDPATIDAVMVTHAHLDHIGRLPKLVKDGYRGPIYATEATIELSTITLKDCLGLMAHRHEREQTPILYEAVDLQRTLDLFQPVPYHQPQPLQGSDSFTLYDAGHILGSASILVEAGGPSTGSGQGKKIVYSGDIGHWPSPLLPKPETPKAADAIVMEGTYGGVEREDRGNRLEILKTALEWTVQNRGVLLIPAFAVERSQELLYLLHYLFHTKQLPKLPIYFDSPLAIGALHVFERHQELFNQEVQRDVHADHNIFSFQNLVITPTGEDSRDINAQAPPKVIIAGSGMMEGGRIHHHLRRYLSHPNTLLLVVGFQAPGTVGQRIVSGAESVRIFGDEIAIKAKVQVVDMFSGHADNSELLEWAKGIELPADGKVFIVHSEADRAKKFQEELEALKPAADVRIASHTEPGELGELEK